jgi:hypothetical protein
MEINPLPIIRKVLINQVLATIIILVTIIHRTIITTLIQNIQVHHIITIQTTTRIHMIKIIITKVAVLLAIIHTISTQHLLKLKLKKEKLIDILKDQVKRQVISM